MINDEPTWRTGFTLRGPVQLPISLGADGG
jgi:hypothetical protein